MDLSRSLRLILHGLNQCKPELQVRGWLLTAGQGLWIDGHRVRPLPAPPKAWTLRSAFRDGEGVQEIPHYTGSYIHYRGLDVQSLPLLRTAMHLVQVAADHGIQQKTREQLEVVWQTAVDSVITIDEKGTVLSCNPATEKMFQFTSAEMIGQNVSMIMPRQHREDHDGYLEHYLSTGKKKIIGIGRRVPAQRKNGHIFPAHLSVSEFYLGGNRYFTGMIRDISDVVEARTRAAVEERKHLSRELHDSVSQALFGIVLGSQAALNALTAEDREMAVSGARESLQYVLSLAESGLSEMRALMFELRPESLEADGLLVTLRRQAEALAKRYQLRASFAFPGTEPQVALTIKHELYRFAMEALHNVVKHARAKSIVMRLNSSRGNLEAEIEDDGIGFIPEDVPAGHVGLQSMRERVTSLGGHLFVDSAPNKGTRIKATLMRADEIPQ